jgi:outer membrane protein assembly factor BamD
MLKKGLQYFILILILASTGCSKFSQVQKKGSFEEKYAAAGVYFEKKDYYHAGTLYEDLLPLSPGRKEAESIRINYAYTQFYQKFYEMSSYYFRKYTETYPRSSKVVEAHYMHGVSLYKMSPKWNLDQSHTQQAIDVMQEFLNTYPRSEFKDKCNLMINEMQVKLETKAYNHTMTYHKIGYYRSAVVSSESFRKNFPDSQYNEVIAYNKLVSQTELANMSLKTVRKDGKVIPLKQNRFIVAKRYYLEFIDKYPDSKYGKEAESLYENILKELKSFE